MEDVRIIMLMDLKQCHKAQKEADATLSLLGHPFSHLVVFTVRNRSLDHVLPFMFCLPLVE